MEDVRVLMCRCECGCIIVTPLHRQMIGASKITDAVLLKASSNSVKQSSQ